MTETGRDVIRRLRRAHEIYTLTDEQIDVLLDAAELLQRLSEWDAWDMADQWPLGDAPYFKREIHDKLQALHSQASDEGKG